MNHWAIQVVTPPTSEPVTLADAKNFLRVDGTGDDAFITSAITTARQYVEDATARALISTQFRMTLERFPFPSNYDRALYSQDQFIPIGPTNAPFYEQFAIRLQRNPVISIDSFKYVDNDGTLQTLAGTEYTLDAVSEQARLLPAYGKAWPIARYQANAVQVTFTAGGADASAVPPGLRYAMFLHISMQFATRANLIDPKQSLAAVDAVLDQHRIWNSAA